MLFRSNSLCLIFLLRVLLTEDLREAKNSAARSLHPISGEYEDYVDDHVNQLVRRIRTVAEFRRNDELGTITYTDRTRAIQLKAGLEHWVRRDNPPAIPDLGPLF